MNLKALELILNKVAEITNYNNYDQIILVNNDNKFEYHAVRVQYNCFDNQDFASMLVDVFAIPTCWENAEELYEGTYETELVSGDWSNYHPLNELPIGNQWATILV